MPSNVKWIEDSLQFSHVFWGVGFLWVMFQFHKFSCDFWLSENSEFSASYVCIYKEALVICVRLNEKIGTKKTQYTLGCSLTQSASHQV